MVSASPAFATKVCYSLTYDVTITSAGTIASVDSADGRGTVSKEAPGRWRVQLSEEQSDPSKDFQLLVEREGGLPQGKVSKPCHACACMLLQTAVDPEGLHACNAALPLAIDVSVVGHWAGLHAACHHVLVISALGSVMANALRKPRPHAASLRTQPGREAMMSHCICCYAACMPIMLLTPCLARCPAPQALVQQVTRNGATKTVALATFVPHVEGASPAPPREVWLVVDGSGSMGGGPQRQARDSALMFIKDLPTGEGEWGADRQGTWTGQRTVCRAHHAVSHCC